MNQELTKLLNGNVKNIETVVMSIPEQTDVAYVNKYVLNTKSETPFVFYIIFKHEKVKDSSYLEFAGLSDKEAYAQLDLPKFITDRWPSKDYENIQKWLERVELKEFDDFEILKATEGEHPMMTGIFQVPLTEKPGENRPVPKVVECTAQQIDGLDKLINEYTIVR